MARGTETPKDRDEVNKRKVSETLSSIVVYDESIKREVQTRPTYECLVMKVNGGGLHPEGKTYRLSCLLLIDKARAKDKTYI